MLTSTSVGQTFGQHDVVLLPQLILRNTMRVSAGLTTMLQQQPPQPQVLSHAYANYVMDPLQVSFSYIVEFHQFLMSCFDVCYGVCCLLSSPHMAAMFTKGRLNHCG